MRQTPRWLRATLRAVTEEVPMPVYGRGRTVPDPDALPRAATG